jgi:outer membrane murein-binding lipoprotein Lpp
MRLFVAAVVAFALVLAGCGASAKPHHAASPQRSQADRMKAVVRAWTTNLDAGNNAAEARLFKLPALISLMEGPYGCNMCLTAAEVVQLHAQLLCSVKIVSIKVRGRYATAVFGHPGDRETSKCDSPPGSLTGVRFTIVRGKITALEQVWYRPPGGPTIAPGGAPIRTPGVGA